MLFIPVHAAKVIRMHAAKVVQMLFILPYIDRIYCGTKAIRFKLLNEDKWIGSDGDSNKLRLTTYDSALKFEFDDIADDFSAKRIRTIDKSKSITENGWWLARKHYSLAGGNNNDKQGIQILYYGPNEYIFMRGGYCLSIKSGEFLKEYCTAEHTSIFNMCKDRKCEDDIQSMKRDIKHIKLLLMTQVSGGLDRNGDEVLRPSYGADEALRKKRSRKKDCEEDDSEYVYQLVGRREDFEDDDEEEVSDGDRENDHIVELLMRKQGYGRDIDRCKKLSRMMKNKSRRMRDCF